MSNSNDKKLNNDFLPVNREDMEKRGWEELDFIYISGEAYVDHPSFGHAVITRVLENAGFKVGIIPQPDCKDTKDFEALGIPRLGVIISSGVIDSMVNNYTVAKKRRNNDVYSERGKVSKRPDRAVIVYVNKIREAYGDIPVIIGGVEASLRRFAHYDYWSDKVRASILMDSKADLISFGMGEHSIVEIAEQLRYGQKVENIKNVRGTVYKTKILEDIEDYILIPSFEEVKSNKLKYVEAFNMQYNEQDPINGKVLVQKHGDWYVVQNKPSLPLTQKELDDSHELPYMRTYHPMYKNGVPSIEEVQFSVISQRGCFGNCSFCSIAFHQGRIIQARSHESILRECKLITEHPDFKGYIHDVGGPTANFRQPSCEKQLKHGVCKNRQCLFPSPCKNLKVSHTDFVSLLRKIRKLPKIKKVFIRSGIRYDYVAIDKDRTFLNELCEHHISGQLKVAPEHVCPEVLSYMGKPNREVYDKFVKMYTDTNKKLGMKQYLVPYLMSSHPGSNLKAAVKMAEYIRDMGYMPEQVQDFYPTPGTMSTCMYYTGIDPRTMKKVYVPKDYKEKAMQRCLLQYKNPKNYDLVHEALVLAGREDLIGYGSKCLIRPKSDNRNAAQRKNANRNSVSEEDRNKKTYKSAGNSKKTSLKGTTVNSKKTSLKENAVNNKKVSLKENAANSKKAGLKENIVNNKKTTIKNNKRGEHSIEYGNEFGKNGKNNRRQDNSSRSKERSGRRGKSAKR